MTSSMLETSGKLKHTPIRFNNSMAKDALRQFLSGVNSSSGKLLSETEKVSLSKDQTSPVKLTSRLL